MIYAKLLLLKMKINRLKRERGDWMKKYICCKCKNIASYIIGISDGEKYYCKICYKEEFEWVLKEY